MTATAFDLAPVVNAVAPIAALLVGGAVPVIYAVRRKPDELAIDNDRLRTRLDSVEQKYDELKDRVDRELRVVGRGFDALVRLVDRMIAHWGDGIIPTLDPVDQADVTAAQKLRDQS